ncbi:hypothetical protein AC579_7604 [Pseudocercospora musae]|uniref:Uncharacterized protein n=1 Tax=Pseudocercospora musae TaxID=113226 RepID=A0A139IDZ8_9PEZI|nr:hypothetical protein AC579_7604 [Pseudocercospora musae]
MPSRRYRRRTMLRAWFDGRDRPKYRRSGSRWLCGSGGSFVRLACSFFDQKGRPIYALVCQCGIGNARSENDQCTRDG